MYDALFDGWLAVADPLADDVVLRHAPDARFRWLLDGMLVLTPQMEYPARISSPGDLIWQALAEPTTVRSLAETLATLFDAPVETVRADIAPILSQFHAWGALISNAG